MGGGSSILLWYFLCGGVLLGIVAVAVGLFFYGESRNKKGRDGNPPRD